MANINKKLELAKYMSEFTVTEKDDEYIVAPRDQDVALVATIGKGCASMIVDYYVSGTYNSGCDWSYIDIDALNRLQKFVELLIKD